MLELHIGDVVGMYRKSKPGEILAHIKKDWKNKEELYEGFDPQLRSEAVDLERLLIQRGYGFSDLTKIWEHGYTVHYRKLAPTDVHPDLTLSFQFYFDNCGGPNFTVGELYAVTWPYPNFKYWAPQCMIQYSAILKANWKDIEMFESYVINGTRAQGVVSLKTGDEKELGEQAEI
jgi:hypothetical protein